MQVEVMWNDGSFESFECSEVRFKWSSLLLQFQDGNSKSIPVHQVRWVKQSARKVCPKCGSDVWFSTTYEMERNLMGRFISWLVGNH